MGDASVDHRRDTLRTYNRIKLRVPAPAQGLMERARLIDRLKSQQNARFTIIQAPAGYGKSILLQQWAAQLVRLGGLVVWLSVDATEGDPSAFLQCLVQALEEAGSPIASRLAPILSQEKFYSWKVVVSRLANSLFELKDPIFLILDDAHHLNDTEALQCVQLLLEAVPANVHLIAATRQELGIPLGRARALGQVAELRADDLRFLPNEAETFLRLEGHLKLTVEQLRALQERSEGWIVGLKLLSLSLRGESEPAHLFKSLNGERWQIADFFSEDVVARQTPELQEFLLRTSVLDRFCPALCDRLMGNSNSRRLIDECEQAGLFLVPLDQTRTWYRYHHLFAEYLARSLQDRSPGERRRMCIEAADWLVEAGYHVEGFQYALLGNNPLRAAEILEASCDSMWRSGQQGIFQKLAARIPPPIQALHPRIMLAIAWRLCMQWQVTEAHQLVEVSKTRVAELELSGKADAAELNRLNVLVQHREGQLAHTTYRVAALEQSYNSLAAQVSAIGDPYILASYYNSLQYAEREQYRLQRIGRLAELARLEVERGGSRQTEVFRSAITGPSYFLAGHTEKALHILSHGLEIAEDLAGRGGQLGAVAALPLSEIHYETNDTRRATELLDLYLPATAIGFVDQLVSGWLTRARLLCQEAKFAEALRVLDLAAQFASEHDLERLELMARIESAVILLRAGRPDDATQIARSCNFYGRKSAADLIQNRNVTRLDGAVAAVWCRLAATHDRLGDAFRVARWWRSVVVNAKAIYEAVRWDILLAQLLALSGDRLAAHRSLAQAAARAAPARLLRPFLDGGEPIAQLLLQMMRGTSSSADHETSFLKELIACFRAELQHVDIPDTASNEQSVPLCGRMNSREIQILELAATGMPNLQIGTKLGLTEGSVKWYLQQIFDKIGVRDRFLAVQRARQFGLMK